MPFSRSSEGRTNPLTSVAMRAARWSATHPWRAIAAWFALVAAGVALAMTVSTVETTSEDYRIGESGRADAWIAEAGLDDPASEQVLLTGADESTLETAGEQVAAAAREADGVTGAEPQWNADRSALLISVQLARDHDESGDVDDLVAAVSGVADAHPGVDVEQVGDVTIGEAIDRQVESDLRSAEVLSLPVTLVLMLLAFGALIAAGLPVLLAATSVAATIGISAPLSHLLPADLTVTSMIVLIGMAVGVDYSLFYLKREREERARGRSTLDAVEIAAQTSGHSILVSGGAVIASLAGLFIMGDATFNSLAVASIVVVSVAVIGSITVLPALLVTLGRWVDRPRIPLLWRLNRRIGHGGISRRLLDPVLRHPLVALVLGLAAVAVLALPALGMKTHSDTIDTLPQQIPQVRTLQTIGAEFPSQRPIAEVVVRADASDRDEVAAALEQLGRDAEASGQFEGLAAPPRTSEDGRTTLARLASATGESDARTDQAIRDLRADLAPNTLGEGMEFAVGGEPARILDKADRQSDRLPLVIVFVLVLTFLMMAFSFRSLPIAAVSMLLNLASTGVAFGLMTLVFQHGHLESLLDFTSPGFLIDWIPLFVLVVLVGLSMDYHVFVVSRIREYVALGVPARLAVRRGVSETAGVITSAAAVMVSVFSIFATLSMLEMKMLGVGLAAAILLDATLVRLVILPAVLVLLGERAWWPVRPDRDRGEPVVEVAGEAAPVGAAP